MTFMSPPAVIQSKPSPHPSKSSQVISPLLAQPPAIGTHRLIPCSPPRLPEVPKEVSPACFTLDYVSVAIRKTYHVGAFRSGTGRLDRNTLARPPIAAFGKPFGTDVLQLPVCEVHFFIHLSKSL